jgi:GAF domain-containing protein
VPDNDGPTGGTTAAASPLDDPGRLRSLAETGLTAAPDETMDEIAARVRRQLDVPVALVSLVRTEDQIFPGMAGLDDPWAARRSTPLSHSMCQHVVHGARPVVIADTRTDVRGEGNVAVAELGLVSYAGFPLLDGDGRVLGSLCAIDGRPRDWTEHQLDVLEGLAAGCSTRLQLLIARYDARRERRRTDDVQTQLLAARDRSQQLLTVSQALARTTDVDDIPATVTDLVSGDLRSTFTGLVLTAGDRSLREIDDPLRALDPARGSAVYRLKGPLPPALTGPSGVPRAFPDRDTLDANLPVAAQRIRADLGLAALVCVPLGVREVTGVLMFGWDAPHTADESEHALIVTLATYVTETVQRVQFAQGRASVARQLQNAMLTTVPPVPGLDIAARYLAAATEEQVGGDWFDVVDLPDRTGGGRRHVSVMVGDISGHDIHAATVMGQVRSMGRQAVWERPLGPPSTVIAAMEQACAAVGTGATGTVLLGHLQPVIENSGLWHMRWANAGHPPPLIRRADGTTSLLPSHDLMFGYPQARTEALADHDTLLLPGDSVVLYTDGLMERRYRDLGAGLRALEEAAGGLVPDDPDAMADALCDAMAVHESEDDVVVLVVHVPGDGSTFPRTRRR